MVNRNVLVPGLISARSLDTPPARHRPGPLLGGHSRRLYQMSQKQETNIVHDILRLDNGQRHLSGAHLRLEGRQV